MEINRNNFKESLGQISKTIDTASFLAIDAEFTGLESLGNSIHAFDTPEDRYKKLLQSAKTFIIVQFGLSAFRYNDETKRYSVSVYNFYIFPRPYSRQAPDVRFTCQSSSLEFLASQGLDFGKIVRDGISYLLPADEEKLFEALRQRHVQQAQYLSPSDPEAPPALKKGPTMSREQTRLIDSSLERIDNFLNANQDSFQIEFMDLEPCNAFLRKCLYEAISQRFKANVHLETKVNDTKQRYIRVNLPRTEDDVRRMELERQQGELQELDDAVGFSKVIKMISSSKKLIVGHNMILDLLHIMDQFCFELPPVYDDFKSATQCLFPRIIDTKHMASSPPFKDFISNTTLADLQKELEKPPFGKVQVDPVDGFPNYSANVRLHEAGYDAYITGLCFLSMANYLGSKSNPKCYPVLAESHLLQPVKNKLHLMRISDIPYINLEGDDMPPSRDHVFHITFDKEKKAADILKLFSPYGNIQIVWLNDTSALAALYKKDQADQAMNALTTARNGWCHVTPYSEYMATMKNATAQRPSAKRKHPDSDPDMPPRKKPSTTLPGRGVSLGIHTIPEEEELNHSMNVDTGSDEEDSSVTSSETAGFDEEDLGEPVAKRSRKDSTSDAGNEKDQADD